VLAIGLVVDDAHRVLENCHRHIEMGKPAQAAADGSREIAFAVVAMSLTLDGGLRAARVPAGNTGKLFAEFALHRGFGVAVSASSR
jgi:multidrug efflux pump